MPKKGILMPDTTHDPTSILPPEIEAERQAILLRQRTLLSEALGVPLLSQEATDYLAHLYWMARAEVRRLADAERSPDVP
jgi:hypothetical protein